MKNWKTILCIAAGVFAVAGIVALVIAYQEEILDFLFKVRDTALSKADDAKKKICPKKVKYTEDELADFADV